MGTTSRVSACAAAATTKKTVGTTGADTCTAACGASTWDNSNVCTAIATCGTQLAVGSADAVARLKGDAAATDGTATANNVCDACTAGTFAATEADNCVACTTVTDLLTDTALTCTSASDSRVVACATAKLKVSSGQADVCITIPTCGNQVAVGSATAVARTVTTAATAYDAIVCEACTAGTFGATTGGCTACNVVADSLADTALTCTSASDSRVVACAVDKQKNAGVDASAAGATVTVTATADTCTTPQAACLAIAGSATLRATTTAADATTDIVCAACAAGTACTAVTDDLDAATLTCTSATDSRTSACAATSTTKKTVGAAGATDTCTATCAAGTWDSSD